MTYALCMFNKVIILIFMFCAGLSVQFCQEPVDHARRLPAIAAAKQVAVIEDVIQIVQILARGISRIQRVGRTIGRMEGWREAAE